MTRTASIILPGRPLTINAERKMVPKQRATEVRKRREAARELWEISLRATELRGKVAVSVQPRYPNRRNLPDIGAVMPTAKAAIDALVDVGGLPDDSPAYVVAMTFLPVIAPTSAAMPDGDLVVTVTEVE